MAEKIDLTRALGEPVPREKIISIIKEDTDAHERFLSFPEKLKEEFLLFCEGSKGIKITYDSFFKRILSPKEHPNRLEYLLESILQQPVKIVEILSKEGIQLVERGSFVIMDIIVSLADGSMVNVEMQKVGYKFPAERSECYASDMTMRQYSIVKSQKGETFNFRDLSPIVLIVIMENSPKDFETDTNAYIHKRQVSYDTGIKLRNLHDIRYINLDIFKKNIQNITNDTDAWLTFFSSDAPEDILNLIDYHPVFAEMYHDMRKFRQDVKEVLAMFSEELLIMDRNLERYMVEEAKQEAEAYKLAYKQAMAEKDSALAEKDMLIAQLQAQLQAQQK